MSAIQTDTNTAPTRRHRKITQQQEVQIASELSQSAELVVPEKRAEVILLKDVEKYLSENLSPLVEKQREDYNASIQLLTQSKDAEIRAVGFKNERLENELNAIKNELTDMKNELEEAEKKIKALNEEIFQKNGMLESLSRTDALLKSQYLKLQRDTDYLYATCSKCGQYYQWKRQHECQDDDVKEYNKGLKNVSHTSHLHTIWVRD